MINEKQIKLNAALNAVNTLNHLHRPVADRIHGVNTPAKCELITNTLLSQAGEISQLTAKIQNLATASNSYEMHWDSLIFAIMGADGTADIIDAADAERITAAAIAVVKKLASDRDEKQRVAEAFQSVSNTESFMPHRRYYHNDTLSGRYSPNTQIHELKIAPEYLEAVICGQKKAETRINDRAFNVNDHLILREWENDGYTGWEHEVVITHVCDFPYAFTSERWVSLSISPVYGLDPDAINRYLNSRRAV